MWLGWMILGCQAEVVISGRVFEGHDKLGFPLVGGLIRLVDDGGAELDAATTGSRGAFSLRARSNLPLFAEISGEGFGISSFTGTTGVERLRVEDGALYGVETRVIDSWTALVSGCPGQDEPGGLVYGEVRLYQVFDPETGIEPSVNTAWAVIESADGQRREACYLTDDGTALAPEATRTGGTGRFAIFGVPSGVHTLEVGYDLPDGSSYTTLWTTWVPDGPGAVVPRFPVYVDFPL